LTGTGKTTAIKRLLDELHLPGEAPPDLCYVHNFRDADAPLALQLPAGHGRILQHDIHELVDHLRQGLPALYRSDAYKTARRAIQERFQARLRAAFKTFETRVTKADFQIVQVQMGPMTRTDLFPLQDGKPVPLETLRTEAVKNKALAKRLPQLEQQQALLQSELEDVLRDARGIERELRDSIRGLDRDNAAQLMRGAAARAPLAGTLAGTRPRRASQLHLGDGRDSRTRRRRRKRRTAQRRREPQPFRHLRGQRRRRQ
jgi:ATP-dependent Lon protease